MSFTPHQILELPIGIFQLWSKQPIGQRPHIVAPIRNEPGVVHHHLMGLFHTQVGKLLHHLIGGAEVKGIGLVGILVLLGG